MSAASCAPPALARTQHCSPCRAADGRARGATQAAAADRASLVAACPSSCAPDSIPRALTSSATRARPWTPWELASSARQRPGYLVDVLCSDGRVPGALVGPPHPCAVRRPPRHVLPSPPVEPPRHGTLWSSPSPDLHPGPDTDAASRPQLLPAPFSSAPSFLHDRRFSPSPPLPALCGGGRAPCPASTRRRAGRTRCLPVHGRVVAFSDCCRSATVTPSSRPWCSPWSFLLVAIVRPCTVDPYAGEGSRATCLMKWVTGVLDLKSRRAAASTLRLASPSCCASCCCVRWYASWSRGAEDKS